MANINETLLALSGTNIAKLAIPKMPNYQEMLFGTGIEAQLNFALKHANQLAKAQQIALSGLAPKMEELAKIMEQQHKTQISAFQSFSERIKPLLLRQTSFAEQLNKSLTSINPTLKAIQTISSYNAFEKYREVYEEFGGDLQPDNFTDEEIERVVEQHGEIIEEVNTAIIQAEADNISPGDTAYFVFNIIQKYIPSIGSKAYNVLVLIFMTVIFFYELGSSLSTSRTIKKVILPNQIEQTEKLKNIQATQEEIKDELNEMNEKIDATDSTLVNINSKVTKNAEKIDELGNSLEQSNADFQDTVDLLIQEMRKVEEGKEK